MRLPFLVTDQSSCHSSTFQSTRPSLLGLLSQHSPQPLNPATLTRWRQRNLLRYKQGQIDHHSAAAILIARLLLPDKKYGWLPSEIPDDEPRWWVWRGQTPVAVSGVTDTSVTHTTPWHGAVWDDTQNIARWP